MQKKNLKIEYRGLDEIHPYENNPRINEKAVAKVIESFKSFGVNSPLLVDGAGVIIAGHTRLAAAKALGYDSMPVVVLSNLTEEQVRQLRLVDNRTAELSTWDYEKLVAELEALPEMDMSVFEFGGFGEANASPARGGRDSNLDEGIELEVEDFADEVFNRECPYCGFRWSE